jgi:hypothetical protein
MMQTALLAVLQRSTLLPEAFRELLFLYVQWLQQNHDRHRT